MFNFRACDSLFLLILFSKWVYSFEKEILNEVNKHRFNAGIKNLSLHEELQKYAKEASEVHCAHVPFKNYSDLENFLKPKNVGWSMNPFYTRSKGVDIGKSALEHFRESILLWIKAYQLPTSEFSCATPENDYFGAISLHFLMDTKTSYVGFNVNDCREHNINYLLILTRISSKEAYRFLTDPIFPEENFLELCSKEAGWRTCDPELQFECIKRYKAINNQSMMSPEEVFSNFTTTRDKSVKKLLSNAIKAVHENLLRTCFPFLPLFMTRIFW